MSMITLKNIQKDTGARSIVCDIYDNTTGKCFAKTMRFKSLGEAVSDIRATFGEYIHVNIA